MNNGNEKKYVIIIILIISSFYILSIRKGNPWSGDFSQYIMQAQSIADRNVNGFLQVSKYRLTNSDEPGKIAMGPLFYPWGFPILLVPIILIAGVNITLMKILGIIFLGLSGWMVYMILRNKIAVHLLLITIVLFLFNPDFLFFKDYITADFPHLFFILLGLYYINYLYDHNEKRINDKISLFILGILIYVATSMRIQAIVLLPTLFLFQILKFREKENNVKLISLLIPHVTFLVFFIAEKLFFFHFTAMTTDLSYPSITITERVFVNLKYYLTLPVKLIGFKVHINSILMRVIVIFIEILYIVAILISIAGMINSRKERLIIIFIIVNILLFLYFPYQQGLRYLYPALPFLIFFL